MAAVLSDEQLAQFERDGLLAIPNFFTVDEANVLRQRALELADSVDLSDHPKTIFQTRNDQQHAGDDYFLNSGDKIRYFFEEGAVDPAGHLTVEKKLAFNKIGHALHELDPAFRKFSLHPRIKTAAKQLHFVSPRILQSMIIFKQPHIGGEVSSHQDSTFLHTNPLSAVGFWFALEDCTTQNGCLEFIPGSHRDGLHNSRRMVRNKQGGVEFTAPLSQYDQSHFVAVPCSVGSVVLIHGSVVHRSSANHSDLSRIIYTFHLIEGANGFVYDELNWLQPTPNMPFTSLLDVQE